MPYLAELGVTYLHLMPLLKPRPGPNDGGYAVMDYRAIRDDLGTMDDLGDLTVTLHDVGISLTLDLVLNHVAREHEWARRAIAGEERYRRYFHMYADRTEPDRYEQTLPEVFPAFAPGNFSWDDEATAWVWTTFNTWQWDLDWSNPDVFCEFVEIVLLLANHGVDCLRLDAIAFLWKREGTNCQNQPEVHAITQALRAAARIAAPALIFKAEAIVGPGQVVEYLGTGPREGRVSDLAYHNSLMVQIWSALAARDCRLLVRALDRFPPKPTTAAWATYLRCHDDIGWAIDDADAASVGLERLGAPRVPLGLLLGRDLRFLRPRRGVSAQPRDRRPPHQRHRCQPRRARARRWARVTRRPSTSAIARLLCAHALLFGFGGPPLIYMGDELGLGNDRAYAQVPEHADDNRWLHRPAMPWGRTERRHDPAGVEGRMFNGIRQLGLVRARLASLHASVETTVHETGNVSVLSAARRHAAETLVQLYNFSEHEQSVGSEVVSRHGLGSVLVEQLRGDTIDVRGGRLTLPPYAAWWLSAGRP